MHVEKILPKIFVDLLHCLLTECLLNYRRIINAQQANGQQMTPATYKSSDE